MIFSRSANLRRTPCAHPPGATGESERHRAGAARHRLPEPPADRDPPRLEARPGGISVLLRDSTARTQASFALDLCRLPPAPGRSLEVSAGAALRARRRVLAGFRKPLVETRAVGHPLSSRSTPPRGAARTPPRFARECTTARVSLMYSTRNVQPDEALRLARAERAVRGDPYTEDALAWALYRHGKFDEARAVSDRACRLGTRDARLLFHQGAIRIAQGRAREGRERVKEALQQNPRFDLIEAAEAERLLAQVRP